MKCTRDGHVPNSLTVRRKPAVGGGERFVRQCIACGRQVGGAIPLARVIRMGLDPRKIERWDAKAAHTPQPGKRKRDYAARFKAPDWKGLRDRVLERDSYTCQHCHEIATQVHHKTYERFWEERLEDLVASCRDCNMAERERRMYGETQ